MSLVVDTDVASVLLRRRLTDPLAGRLAEHVLAVTFVTVGRPYTSESHAELSSGKGLTADRRAIRITPAG